MSSAALLGRVSVYTAITAAVDHQREWFSVVGSEWAPELELANRTRLYRRHDTGD